MLKVTEVEKKNNRRNKSTYWQANKYLFMENFRPLFPAVSPTIVIGLFILFIFIYLIRYLKSMFTIVKKLIYFDNKKT